VIAPGRSIAAPAWRPERLGSLSVVLFSVSGALPGAAEQQAGLEDRSASVIATETSGDYASKADPVTLGLADVEVQQPLGWPPPPK
jgi:hypothetical protein